MAELIVKVFNVITCRFHAARLNPEIPFFHEPCEVDGDVERMRIPTFDHFTEDGKPVVSHRYLAKEIEESMLRSFQEFCRSAPDGDGS